MGLHRGRRDPRVVEDAGIRLAATCIGPAAARIRLTATRIGRAAARIRLTATATRIGGAAAACIRGVVVIASARRGRESQDQTEAQAVHAKFHLYS
ncbi:MAG TPA: hypothetical protein VKB80_16620 [Kofleriaceae bacterium]|nr:hypothetical protein [Kofleriaceae bacterium]